MKRKIAAAAALSLVLGLTACTSDTSDSSSDSSNAGSNRRRSVLDSDVGGLSRRY